MVGFMSAFLVDHDVLIGDVTKNTLYFLSQGFSEDHIKTDRVAWTSLTESVVNRDLLGRLFAPNHLVLAGECCVIGLCPRPWLNRSSGR